MSGRHESAQDRAERRLKEWGKERECIGFPALSMFAKIKLERDGAAHRAVILGDGTLNAVENQAETRGRVAEIERLVRGMPGVWIVVVYAVYVEQQSQSAIAKRLEIDRKHVGCRHRDALERIAAELDRPYVVQGDEGKRMLERLLQSTNNVSHLTLGPTTA